MRKNGRGHIHFLGICGKGMGAIAGALARQGWQVTGSEENCYSPMSDYLESCGIEVCTPYRAENIRAETSLVIVGKRARAENPELQHAIACGIPLRSFPKFLRQEFLGLTRNVVVAGGVGKTTTTAMLSWILEDAGRNPDYLIGGFARNFPAPARFGGDGNIAILEGDEYVSCFDDATPKFLHYAPTVAVITNLIEDHPDCYPRFEDVAAVFASLARSLPRNGSLVIRGDDPAAEQLASVAACKIVRTGFDPSLEFSIRNPEFARDGSRFTLGQVEFEIPMCGRMNISNAAQAALAAAQCGVTLQESARALRRFEGVRFRQEEKLCGDCVLVLDKASHPVALAELERALRQRYPGRRLFSVIQPRATGGRHWIYQERLPEALSRFDKIILMNSYEHNPPARTAWARDPFSLEQLHSDLRARAADVLVTNSSEAPRVTADETRAGDVILLSIPEQAVELVGRFECALDSATELVA